MLLFVGLGNPTPDSENNRHNIGFKMIDAINQKFNLSKQKPKFKGLLTTGNINENKVYAMTKNGNGNYVNLLKLAWQKTREIISSKLIYL